jgi:ectoine hydroxylase-related dioxygenase (phytanoyl-CoA dioxygenase family)
MLTRKQIASYHENGFIHVKGLLTPTESRKLRKETHALAERLQKAGAHIDATWQSAKNTIAAAQNTKILHCHDVQFHSALFSQLLVDERFTGTVSQLIGTPNVQLHHTKMFIKPPEKGSPFPMHQDYPYFPHKRHSMMAVIFHFDDAPVEKGCLRVIPGSHKNGPLRHRTEGGWHLPPKKYPVDDAMPIPAKAGDAIFFSYLTVHGSGLNVSSEPRTTLLVQVRDPEDVPTVATHNSRGQGMMLRGIDPTINANACSL